MSQWTTNFKIFQEWWSGDSRKNQKIKYGEDTVGLACYKVHNLRGPAVVEFLYNGIDGKRTHPGQYVIDKAKAMTYPKEPRRLSYKSTPGNDIWVPELYVIPISHFQIV